jgi:hypothetical protein
VAPALAPETNLELILVGFEKLNPGSTQDTFALIVQVSRFCKRRNGVWMCPQVCALRARVVHAERAELCIET